MRGAGCTVIDRRVIDRGRYPILGVGINAMDAEAAAETVMGAALTKHGLAVSCSAVHSVMMGALDSEHRRRLNSLGLVLPDGQPVRWALRWRHAVEMPDRVRGPDFMLALCRRAEAEGLAVFFYGSRSAVLQRLTQSLRRSYPRLIIAGARPSAFRTISEAEQLEIAAEIRASGAALVFAGLGCPRQEIWAYENASLLQMPVVAVGAAFDLHAGMIPHAPDWMKQSGLEWLFRLGREPRRLWKRYLFLNPLYLLFLGFEAAGLARFNDGSTNHPRPVRVA